MGRYFNPVQSECFELAYRSDTNMVISAPTGAGKTGVMELAMLRLLSPIKALVQEKQVDWADRYGSTLGLRVVELTSDADDDSIQEQLEAADIVCSTPEKFDQITRKAKEKNRMSLFAEIGLVLIDEIHLLGDAGRGSFLEAGCICRMKALAASEGMAQTQLAALRFVGVSATIPNIADIANWLGVPEAGVRQYGEELRPCKLTTHVKSYQPAKNEFMFEKRLNEYVIGVVLEHSSGRPTLVFCNSRKGAKDTAETLVKDASARAQVSPQMSAHTGSIFVKSLQQLQHLQAAAARAQDTALAAALSAGVGYHHAAMEPADRSLVEELFKDSQLQVICTTSTLAMGVNLPARLVIIKGTSRYVGQQECDRGEQAGYKEYAMTEVLQMVGRAGRPQFDTEGVAVIMTSRDQAQKYQRLLTGQAVESCLMASLPEHLNAEVVLGTITDVTEAIAWIKSTFLFVRARANPQHYGPATLFDADRLKIKAGMGDAELDSLLRQQLVMKPVSDLLRYKLIETDEDTYSLNATAAGKLMAAHFLKLDTMASIVELGERPSMPSLLRLICGAEELKNTSLRRGEKSALNNINHSKEPQQLRYHVMSRAEGTKSNSNKLKQRITTPAEKLYILLNDGLADKPCDNLEYSLKQEQDRLLVVGQRIAKCMAQYVIRYYIVRGSFSAAGRSLLLARSLKARLWEDSSVSVRQLQNVGRLLASRLAAAGLGTMQTLAACDEPHRVEVAAQKSYYCQVRVTRLSDKLTEGTSRAASPFKLICGCSSTDELLLIRNLDLSAVKSPLETGQPGRGVDGKQQLLHSFFSYSLDQRKKQQTQLVPQPELPPPRLQLSRQQPATAATLVEVTPAHSDSKHLDVDGDCDATKTDVPMASEPGMMKATSAEAPRTAAGISCLCTFGRQLGEAGFSDKWNAAGGQPMASASRRMQLDQPPDVYPDHLQPPDVTSGPVSCLFSKHNSSSSSSWQGAGQSDRMLFEAQFPAMGILPERQQPFVETVGSNNRVSKLSDDAEPAGSCELADAFREAPWVPGVGHGPDKAGAVATARRRTLTSTLKSSAPALQGSGEAFDMHTATAKQRQLSSSSSWQLQAGHKRQRTGVPCAMNYSYEGAEVPAVKPAGALGSIANLQQFAYTAGPLRQLAKGATAATSRRVQVPQPLSTATSDRAFALPTLGKTNSSTNSSKKLLMHKDLKNPMSDKDLLTVGSSPCSNSLIRAAGDKFQGSSALRNSPQQYDRFVQEQQHESGLSNQPEFDECSKVIDQTLEQSQGKSEYALYVKALIERHQGRIQESLKLFQQATFLNPQNIANLKQVARSLYLLSRYRAAIDVYDEALKLTDQDWELWFNKGLCAKHSGDLEQALQCFDKANAVQPQDTTYMQIGAVHIERGELEKAVNIYLEALQHSPENPDILTTLGVTFLRLGDNQRAFDHLGTSMMLDPKNSRTILAAGSIMQDHQDTDVALVKYRIAAATCPSSPQLWNNIGMCFFAKQKYIAAIACLKRALYLGPFEWLTCYNLGLVHLSTGQAASAFHNFSTAINLRPDFAHSYMYLGIALTRLEDCDNAAAAYKKAISMDPTEPLFRLNFAVLLANSGDLQRSRQQLEEKAYMSCYQ
eukprot:gene11878-12022_t